MPDYKSLINEQLQQSAQVLQFINEKLVDDIAQTGALMVDCYKAGGKLLVCGNGGSAADAQHFAAELVGRLNYHRAALPAIALTTDTSILTAVANDYSFNEIFTRQVEALGQAGDILVGLSTSGNSGNVIQAIHAAKAKKMTTIALLGKNGGTLAGLADYKMIIPSQTSQKIQEGHITIIHLWCEIVEKTLFPVK